MTVSGGWGCLAFGAGKHWGIYMMWKEDKDEIIAHEWMTLKLLWDRCKANAANKQDHDKIDALFSEQPKWSSQPQDWYALNQGIRENLVVR
ncbi:MAG: hypothetical protein M3178_17325 [Pseudomonadota bacterium]|nr:hypothetical protein [Pseudomonadota bacterium]